MPLLTNARALLCVGLTLVATAAHAAVPIEHWTLPNGAKVYMAATDALPIVDVQIDFDAGSRRDPPAQAGLAGVTAGMVEKGIRASGAEPAMDQNALGEAWADLGANFDASAGSDRMSFSLRTLAKPDLLDKAVRLAAREIGEPAFPEDVWQRERERLNASIRESNTKPATLAARTFGQDVYGSHPYGLDTTEATLARIDTAAMRQRYEQMIQPCRAKLSIVGAVTRAQADAIATTLLSRLPVPTGGCPALPPVGDVAPLAAAKDERLPFESAQAHVWIGQPGYPRSDADHFALTLGNYILGGGGFVSRLTDEVREKRGLAYSVYSTFSPGLHAGAFRIGFQTRPDQAAEAVKVSRDVVAKFVAEGPTAAELKAAKDNLIGGFPLLLDSNRKLLGNVANIAWNDLPLDYLDTWTARMNAVTVADIKAAFARKLQPDRMVTVVVGGKP
ncbi:pitrilysin family protein [Variovorax sp. KK3]|uniref:M16 family metallopeptidase n=1 Tax=Variovorax sp. KK3 TaxID=1855728 RepID=UPI00097C7A2D|nr:pitrilysin family protein [Variovorax sp. KK3]